MIVAKKSLLKIFIKMDLKLTIRIRCLTVYNVTSL
jgi:hypothetical protein